jgi:hypothetical protein
VLLKPLVSLATISFSNIVQLQLLVPSICTTHYGYKEPLSADWIKIGEETDKDGITTPIFTVCKPA